jgi:ABC-type amino acid transport substrate-binding protein
MQPFPRIAIALGAFLVSLVASAQSTVPAYNTYQSVPYMLEGQSGGLAADLVNYLNSKGKFNLELQNMPRERLNEEVLSKPGFKGVVLFLNPAFVGDTDKKKYLWTPAIMNDKNEVISSLTKKVEYSNPDSLKGLRFSGIRGNKYAGLEDKFGKDIQRTDVNNELQILKLVANDRSDVAIMASSSYNYLMKTHGATDGLTGKLFASSVPHAKFDRFMFVSNSDAALAKELSAITASMASDPAWKAILSKYSLN